MDSGACASVVRKETFDIALRTLGLHELKDEPVRQNEHRFGPSETVTKIICAVQFSFVCATQDGKEVQFHIRFDVAEGHLPFLIDLPPLKAIAETLSFKRKSLSMVINKVLYRIQLVDKNSHLHLPLRSKSTFSKALGDSLNMVSTAPRSTQHYQRESRPHYFATNMSKSEKLSNSTTESQHQNQQKNMCSVQGPSRSRRSRRCTTRKEAKQAVCHSSASGGTDKTTQPALHKNVESEPASSMRSRPVCSVTARTESASVRGCHCIDHHTGLDALAGIIAGIVTAICPSSIQFDSFPSSSYHLCHNGQSPCSAIQSSKTRRTDSPRQNGVIRRRHRNQNYSRKCWSTLKDPHPPALA